MRLLLCLLGAIALACCRPMDESEDSSPHAHWPDNLPHSLTFASTVLKVPGFPNWDIQRLSNRRTATVYDESPLRQYLKPETPKTWQLWELIRSEDKHGSTISASIYKNSEVLEIDLPMPDLNAGAMPKSGWFSWLSSRAFDVPKFLQAFYQRALGTESAPRMFKSQINAGARGTIKSINAALGAVGHILSDKGKIETEIKKGQPGWDELMVESSEFAKLAQDMEKGHWGSLSAFYVHRGNEDPRYAMIAVFS